MKLADWKTFARWPVGSYGPIGVDIGAHTVKAVQVCRTGEVVSIVSVAKFARAGEKESIREVAGRLRSVLHRQNFRGREVVLAAPPKRLEADLLELPPRSSGAPIETLARVELARSAGLNSVPFEMACWDLPTAERSSAGTSMMAVAMRHSDAEELVDQFGEVGLTVRAIDAAACAYSRAIDSPADESATTAILDLGWTGFRLVLVSRGVVIYQRVLCDAGLAALHREVATRLEVSEEVAQFAIHTIGMANAAEQDSSAANKMDSDIDPGEATRIRMTIARYLESLTGEIHATFAYASHRFPELPIKHLIVGGGGAMIPGLARTLCTRMKIETNPRNHATCVRADDPTFMVATGLALYEKD